MTEALSVLAYPDPALARPAEAVTVFDGDLADFAGRLAAMLATVPAIGLAASHVGDRRRIMAVRLDGDGAARVYVNPVVVRTSTATARHDEGSVAMPGITAEVERPAEVEIAFQDIGGTPGREVATGFRAAVLQHEIDQLDGIFWIERLSRLKRDRLLKRWKKIGA